MKQIKVEKAMLSYVPGIVFQQAPFVPNFKECHLLNAEFQRTQLAEFKANPKRRSITCIGDTLQTPAMGRYFAVWMAQCVNTVSPGALPLYVYCDDSEIDEYTGFHSAPEMRVEIEPSCLIISMGQTLKPIQCERARDIITRWDRIPAFVQCSQHLPLEISTSIGKPCHRAFYLTAVKETRI